MTETDTGLTIDRKISTHTLTWSVTGVYFQTRQDINNFNSHAHVERDDQTGNKKYQADNFNSHAHVERDGATVEFTIDILNFNSHAHVERDHVTASENSHP